MVFTITSFSGDFNKLNEGALPVVRIIDSKGRVAAFYKAVFDGKMQTITVPFFEELWTSNDVSFKTLFQNAFIVEILGDWTQGVETVAIDNIDFY